MRSIGLGFAHSLIAYSSVMKGLGKIEINGDQLEADLEASQDVLAEPIQTVMRRYSVEGAYEKLKVRMDCIGLGWSFHVTVSSGCPSFSVLCPLFSLLSFLLSQSSGTLNPKQNGTKHVQTQDLTRGQTIGRADIEKFVGGLDEIPEHQREMLSKLTPSTYLGNAAEAARGVTAAIRSRRE